MAGETNTDRISKLEQSAAALVERVDNLRREVERADVGAATASRSLQDNDKRLALVTRDLERLEKKPDELLGRRWDLWKLVLAAFLGGILTVASGFLSRTLDRLIAARPGRPIATNQGIGREMPPQHTDILREDSAP